MSGRAGGRTEEDLHAGFVDCGVGFCGPEGTEEEGVVGRGVFAGGDEAANGVAVVGLAGCNITVFL